MVFCGRESVQDMSLSSFSPLKNKHIYMHPVHFDCVVYTRERPCDPFRFHHVTRSHLMYKPFPWDWSAPALKAYQDLEPMAVRYMKQPSFILVTSDTAVSLSPHSSYHQCTPFYLFQSQYSFCNSLKTYEEIEKSHFPWILYSTWAVYEKGKLKCVHEFESGIILLPQILPMKDVSFFQKQMRQCISKCLTHSLWTGDNQALYRESTLMCMKPLVKCLDYVRDLQECPDEMKDPCLLEKAPKKSCDKHDNQQQKQENPPSLKKMKKDRGCLETTTRDLLGRQATAGEL